MKIGEKYVKINIHMNLEDINLRTEKYFWKLRKLKNKAVFKVKVFVYKVKEQLLKIKNEIPFKKRIYLEVVKQVVKSGIVILFVCMLETIISSSAVQGNMNSYNGDIIRILNWVLQYEEQILLNKSFLADLLIGIIGVAGVYLGLYCSNMMSVFSERYANAPQTISQLFENDILTNDCLRAITSYLVLTVLILVCFILGITNGVLTLGICILFGIKIIVSFGLIGKRSYRLADMYYLTNPIYAEIYKNFRFIKEERGFAKDASFQAHCRKLNFNLLSQLEQINDYCIENKDNKVASVESFMRNNLLLLKEYWNFKTCISYDSEWYQEKVVYKKWYQANSYEVQQALNRGGAVGYTKEKDYFWFEDIILSLNNKCFAILVERQEVQSIYRVIEAYNELIPVAVENGCVNYHLLNMNEVLDSVLEMVTESENKFTVEEEMFLVETVEGSYLKTILDMTNYLKRINIEGMMNHALDLKDNNAKFYNHEDYQRLREAIKVERKIEKRRITPNWYIEQVVAKHIYDELLNFYWVLDKIADDYMIRITDILLDKNLFSGALISCTKMNEVKTRSEKLFDLLDEKIKELKEKHIEKSIIWEDDPGNRIQKRFEEIYRELPKKWVQCAGEFTVQNWTSNDKYPDLLGTCYNYMCDHLVNALAETNYDDFELYYENMWNVTVIYQEMIRQDVILIKEKHKQHMAYLSFCAPVIEFGEISGYAYILGEILDDSRWVDLIQSSFEKNIAKMNNIESYLEQMVEIFNFCRRPYPAISSRDVIQTSWKQLIENAFEQLEEIKWEYNGFKQQIKTEKWMLKALIKNKESYGMFCYEVYEVFAIFVLNKHIPEEKRFCGTDEWEKDISE